MPELVLKIDPGSGYEDGDVLFAINRRRIRCVHAEHICHVKVAPRNSSGLIVPGEVCHDWFEATHQYRFERVSASEIKRVEIATGVEEVLGDKPNKQGEYIDVRLFLQRRRKQSEHYLFGEDGAEFWYGGHIDFSDSKLTAIWNAIETKTPLRERDHVLWPAGQQELKSHLFVSVDDFTDQEADNLTASVVTRTDPQNPVIVKKREHQVTDWAGKLNLSVGEVLDVRNKSQPVDLRVRAAIPHKQLVNRKAVVVPTEIPVEISAIK